LRTVGWEGLAIWFQDIIRRPFAVCQPSGDGGLLINLTRVRSSPRPANDLEAKNRTAVALMGKKEIVYFKRPLQDLTCFCFGFCLCQYRVDFGSAFNKGLITLVIRSFFKFERMIT